MISLCNSVSRVSYSPHPLRMRIKRKIQQSILKMFPYVSHLSVGKTSTTSAIIKVVEQNSKSSSFTDRRDLETDRTGEVNNSGGPLNQSDTFNNFSADISLRHVVSWVLRTRAMSPSCTQKQLKPS